MRNYLNVVLTVLIASMLGANDVPEYLQYEFAIVRDLSSEFENSLKLNPPPIPIDLVLAHEQHENYITALKQLVPNVIRIESDPAHPDCNFIEDTAIIVKDIAVISRMGALERRGEEVPVEASLKELGIKTIWLQPPGTMDGGDILYTGRHLFVGISKRTNIEALRQLQEIFDGIIDVIGIPVLEGLHLKSVISLFDEDTLIVAETSAGNKIQTEIHQLENSNYTFVSVPDSTASNVLRVGTNLIIQEGFPESEKILTDICHQKNIHLVKLDMSELIKADGALTCGSLLIPQLQENTRVSENSIGKAVYSSFDFIPGDLILKGWGEASPCRSRYTIQVDVDSHIVPEEPFIWLNHSCQPNCGLLISPELNVIELHAIRPIEKGDELKVDYATFELEIDFMPEMCLCGSETCRGRITGYRDLSEELRKAYGPFIAPYLR